MVVIICVYSTVLSSRKRPRTSNIIITFFYDEIFFFVFLKEGVVLRLRSRGIPIYGNRNTYLRALLSAARAPVVHRRWLTYIQQCVLAMLLQTSSGSGSTFCNSRSPSDKKFKKNFVLLLYIVPIRVYVIKKKIVSPGSR